MKNTLKVSLLIVLALVTLLTLTNISNAANSPIVVDSETSLVDAIASAQPGDIIKLGNNITLQTKALEIHTNDLTIDGNGYAIIGTSGIEGASSPKNKTIITAMAGSEVTLKNITLQDGPKYGVQAFDGSVILDNVSINNCTYGGVLVNGGTVTVKDLSLGYNGENSNNGIEIDRGSSTGEPALIMDGKLSTSETENVIRVLTTSKIENTKNTINKVFVNENSVLLTDANDSIIATGAIEGSNVTVGGVSEKVVLTIIANNISEKVVVDKNSTITEEFVKDHIAIDNKYVIDGFFTDDTYATLFDFDATIDTDTSIYIKVSVASENVNGEENTGDTSIPYEEQQTSSEKNVDGQKDDTPKTGIANYLGIAASVAVIATIAVVSLKRKNA